MTRVASIAAAMLVALQAATARGIELASGCAVIGLTAVDAFHAQPADVLAFEIALGSSAASPYRGPPQRVLARIGGTTAIRVDVVLTADAARFPDFAPQEVLARGSLRPVARPVARAAFGPFAVGEHTVTTVVHVADDATGALRQVCDAKVASFTVYPDSGLAPVVEFHHAASDRYYITQDVDEIGALDRHSEWGWTRTGYDFLAYRPGESGVQLQRIARYRGRSDAATGSHVFVAALSSEALELTIGERAAEWMLDASDAFEVPAVDAETGACPAATIPVYRLSNGRTDGNRRFTTDPAIRAQMIARGYVPEGSGPDRVAFCAIAP